MFNSGTTLRAIQILTVSSMVIVTTFLFVTDSQLLANATSVVPSCEGSNLVGAFVRNQVATGHVVTTIAVTNVGTATCKLGGYPHLDGLRGERKFSLRVTAHGTYGGNLRPTTLAPRMSGAVIIGTGDLCGPGYGVALPGHSYSGLILILPNNEGYFTVPGVTLDTSCGLAESQLGWRNHFSIQGV